jgi:hypothetical protein
LLCNISIIPLPFVAPLSHGTGNNIEVASVCRLVPSLLNKPQLSKVSFDHCPSSCIDDAAWWLQAGLVVPPDEVVQDGWTAVLQFLRAEAEEKAAADMKAAVEAKAAAQSVVR